MKRFLPLALLTVPKLLKGAGCTTACIGRYGLGLPLPARARTIGERHRFGREFFCASPHRRG